MNYDAIMATKSLHLEITYLMYTTYHGKCNTQK
jgi:hypothetical protein